MRIAVVCIVGLFAGVAANAGYVEIGSSINGSTGVSTGGLNVAYLTATPAPTTNGFSEKDYTTTLFANDTLSQAAPGTTSNSQQFVDPNNLVPFAMIANSLNGGTNPDGTGTGSNPYMNYWQGVNTTTAASSAITIPVGYATNEAFIMLTDAYGITGSNYTVLFTFADAAPLSVPLTIGTQISDDQQCGNTGTFSGQSCTTYVKTTSSPWAGGTTDVAWSAAYTNTSSSTTVQYSGTTGNVVLLDLAFNLSSYANNDLLSITITDPNDLNNSSKLALSAITINATPEPSTIVLLLAGCGLIGIRKLRSRA